MRVIVAGGGTGGHIYPGLAIAKEIQGQEPGAEILFLGTSRGLEVELVPREGFSLQTIPLRALKRSFTVDNLRAVWDAAAGVWRAMRIMAAFRPHVVVGTGGYVSGPVVVAGKMLGCLTFLQEQNALPGLTTRWLAPWVDLVFLGYAEAASRLSPRAKTMVTGNPVRAEVLAASREEGIQLYQLDPGRKTILIFGASQGARRINQAFLAAVEELHRLPWLQVIHQTGQRGYEEVAAVLRQLGAVEDKDHLRWDNIQVYPYLYRMGEALAAADVVVARAGAISLAEITALGKPSILIPLPTAAENHQEYNARVLEKNGAAIMVRDRELDGKTLLTLVTGILTSAERYQAMAAASRKLGRRDAAAEIARQIREKVKVMHRAAQR